MRDKSQIEDMRAAVRGDIERARARREADPWRTPEPAQASEPEPEPAAEPVAEPVSIEAPTASEGLATEVSVPAEASEERAPAEEAETPEPEAEPDPKRPGFLSRLFGRG